MKRFWTGLLSCMTIIVLTTFLPAAAAANAIPANCGAWNIVSSWDVGAASFLDAVTTVSANDVWAVGAYGNSEELLDRTLIEQWDGMTWNLVPSPNVPNALDDQLYAVGAVSANDAWAVGESDNSNSDNHNILTEHWDGNTWSIIASPTGNRVVYGVAAISTSNVWAVGATVNQTTGHGKSLIMQWNGTSWSIVPSPNITRNGSSANQLDGVTVSGPTTLWAAGTFENFGHGNRGLSTLTLHTTKG